MGDGNDPGGVRRREAAAEDLDSCIKQLTVRAARSRVALARVRFYVLPGQALRAGEKCGLVVG
jgi:hypothetical protein